MDTALMGLSLSGGVMGTGVLILLIGIFLVKAGNFLSDLAGILLKWGLVLIIGWALFATLMAGISIV